MLDGFGKSARSGRSVGAFRCAVEEDVRGKQSEAEAEIWGGEDREGLDENVGRCLVAGKVGVELVSSTQREWSAGWESRGLEGALVVGGGGSARWIIIR